MKQLLKDIASFYWWLTAVFLALGINLAAAYAKPLIDRFAAKVSKRWSDQRQRKNSEREQWIAYLAKDPTEMVVIAYMALQLMVMAALFCGLTFSFLMLAELFRIHVSRSEERRVGKEC